MIKDVSDKDLVKVLALIKTIRPDCEPLICKVDKFYCKHIKEDLGAYDFTEYMDYIEKKLVYETGPINLGVIMNWGQEYKVAKTRTWTAEEKKARDNFYTGAIDTTN
jgi:hypothetical protein